MMSSDPSLDVNESIRGVLVLEVVKVVFKTLVLKKTDTVDG
jgi:hypothetical protein